VTPTKLLLVDDRPENLTALSAALRRPDRELLLARSGREALELLLADDIALALIDVEMPEMDGFELAELMRGAERTRAIPIIFVTAWPSEQSRVFNGYEAGAVDFLSKPLDTRVLNSKVDVFLELHRQRRQLVDRIAELEAVLAAVPAGVYIARDPSGTRIDANRFGRELMGLQPDGSPGTHGTLRYFRDEREIPPDELPIRIAAGGQELRGCAITLGFEDGTSRDLFGNATPMRGPDGVVRGAVGAFVDVSELKRAEARLREADRRKDEFLAILSHELRNPLMPIRTSLYILERGEPGSDNVRRAMATMTRQVQHLARLIDDLLDVTRITRGKMELRREPLVLQEVAARAVEDHAAAAEAAGLTLSSDLALEPLRIDGDPTRLAQVIGNLLGNAIKFTPAGGQVWLEVAREAHEAVVRVTDTGVGIGPEIAGQLFEPFAQADHTLERSRGGLGLGLALVKLLAEMHGGQVAMQSQGEGSGAEFIVRLPLLAAATTAPARKAAARKAVIPRRVLLVEDNPDGAEALEHAIRLMGHEVAVAHDGLTALELARSFRPDTFICDIGLPGIDGYELARRVASDERLAGARLVALTGYALPQDRERVRAAGFIAHLAKPPRLDELEALLAEPPSPPST